MEKQLNRELFSFEGKPSLGAAFPLAMQHVVAMIAGCITPALLISGNAKLSPADSVLLVQMSLVISGISTLLMLYPLGKIVGARLPVIMGASFAYVPTLVAVAKTYSEALSPTDAIAIIFGAQLIGGLVAIVFSGTLKYVLPFFPPIVTGTVIFVIGLSLYPIAIRYIGGAGSVAAPGWGSVNNWIVGGLTLVAAFVFNNFAKGVFKLASVLFAMIVGYIIAIPFGMVNLSSVGEAGLFALATPLHFGIKFEPSVIISLVILFIVNSIQAIGDLTSTTVGGLDRTPTHKELRNGVLGYGVMNILGALTCCPPSATFSQNVGIVSTNKVTSRRVFSMAAIIIIIAGLFPKLSAFLTTIPDPVIGGATISVFAMITMNGIRLLTKQPLTARNTTIIGLSVAIGVGFTSVVTEAAAAGVNFMPATLKTAVGTSPVVLAALVAIILNIVLKEKPEDRARD